MNGKAAVSKELNDRHKKILEGLLKLPGNRECADCKTRAPRWASVNLGIFICMQCSGIHRSLGVHISKVRSATLDTWLPEQIAHIQSMGNEKSNFYWEADLPPNYDRVGIENFIRAKYEEKRWVSREGTRKSPTRVIEESVSSNKQDHRSNGGQTYNNTIRQSPFENRNTRVPSSKVTPATVTPKSDVSVPRQAPVQNEAVQKPGSSPARNEPKTQQVAKTTPDVSTPVAAPPKVDYATELFNMLSMDAVVNDVKSSPAPPPAVNHDWAGFQSVAETPVKEKVVKTTQTKAALPSGIEELFTDSWPTTSPNVQNPQKDSKDDILNLFNKSGMVSPYTMHQQQLATLAQQQTLLMAAAAKSGGLPQLHPGNMHQPASNSIHIPNQNWGGYAPQPPMPVPIQMGNTFSTNIVNYSSPGMYNTGPVAANSTIRPPANSPMQPHTPTRNGNEYDFSSLMSGTYTRR